MAVNNPIEDAAAYTVGISIFKGTLKFSDGVLQLNTSLGMNKSSAAHNINAITKMMGGDVFKRTLRDSTIEYYISHILSDFGYTYAKRAIQATMLHVDYFESSGSAKRPGLRRVISRLLPDIEKTIDTDFEKSVDIALLDDLSVIENRLKIPLKKRTESNVFIRDPDVVAATLLKSKWICKKCTKPAPFIKKSNNKPYLEVHHVIPLSKDGEDILENCIAVCPNCHRELHYG